MRKTLFLLLALCALHFSQSCLVDPTAMVLGSEEGSLLRILIALSVVAIAIAYAFGTAMNKPEATVFAKDEGYHFLISIALLLGFTGLVSFSCVFTDYFLNLGKDNLVVTSPCYVAGQSTVNISICYTKQLQTKMSNMVTFYTQGQINMLMDSAWSFTAGDFWGKDAGTKTTSLEAYKKAYAAEADILVGTYLLPASISISMQRIVLEQIENNIFSFILPAAFVLRFFIPTRQAGNFLIALCVGLYIVFPFFVLFGFMMYGSLTSTDCSKYNGILYDKPINHELGAQVCSDDPAGVSLWDIGKMLPIAFFLPNLSIALLVTFVSAVNKALKVVG